MSFASALVSAVLSLLMQEDPTLKRSPEQFAQWQKSVPELVDIHLLVTKKSTLVSPQVDALILATVNYAETRFRLPAPKGDCYKTHPYRGVPSLRWPKGYVPKMRTVCPAVGPMNVAQGNRFVVHEWPEVVELLPRIVKKKLSVKEMEQSRINIKLAYGILTHWKAVCPNKDKAASAASWLTAYRWGRCTPQHWNKRYFDGEAKRRCKRLAFMAAHIRQQGIAVVGPNNWSCLPAPSASRLAQAPR